MHATSTVTHEPVTYHTAMEMSGCEQHRSPGPQARLEVNRKMIDRGPRIVSVSSITASNRLKEKRRCQRQRQRPNGQQQGQGQGQGHQNQMNIKIPPERLEEINATIIARKYSWTRFHHMGKYEQELLWVVEASKQLTSKSNSISISPADQSQSQFDYMKKNISMELATMTDIRTASSVSMIMREQSAAMPQVQKMEFAAKRDQAAMAIRAMIDELLACRKMGGKGYEYACYKKRRLDSYFHERWNRFGDCTTAKARGKDVLKRDDIVYISETGFNGHAGESELTCYRCKVLGCKEVEEISCSGGFVYYNVMKDDCEMDANGSHAVERVHAESILTQDEIGELIDMELERRVSNLTPSSKDLYELYCTYHAKKQISPRLGII